MCKAMENREKRNMILGVIDYMRDEGKSENEIIKRIMEKYSVGKEYVLALLSPQRV